VPLKLGKIVWCTHALGGEQLIMKMTTIAFTLGIALFTAGLSPAQSRSRPHRNERLTQTEFRDLAAVCAPNVPLVTLRAVVRAESAFHQYALSLDHPRRTAREQGLRDGGIFLARQPTDLGEARAWAHWLINRGRNVSIGLMQVSTQHAADLGVTVDQLFDPCTNMQAGARLLTAKYQDAARSLGEGQTALNRALSQYNSGSIVVGRENGYVATVIDGEFHPRQLP